MATGQLAESGRSLLRLSGTPVFLYHGLTRSASPSRIGPHGRYWLSATQFHEQLSCIRRQGCKVARLSEVWNSARRSDQQDSTVSLTFDDGRWSDYALAFPMLLKAGAQAEFFLNTANIGARGFLSWCQVQEMQRVGMSFQSHGHEHADLLSLSVRELERQLRVSKQLLEDRLGRSVDFLAVPYGRHNYRVVETALSLGYRAVCNSRSWPATSASQVVNRVAIHVHTTLRAFERLLRGHPASYAARAARAMLLYVPKSVLWRFWRPQIDTAPLEDPT